MSGSTAVVYDETALLALGSGNQLASQFMANTEHGPTRHVYVPALSLLGADSLRKGLAEHVGALPAAEIVELDFSGVAAVGALMRDGVEWRLGHAVHLSRPTPDWPDGRPVVTTTPELYADMPLVRTIRLPEQR
ncbi:PIN domain-containing protein [Streptomyces sp. O3]